MRHRQAQPLLALLQGRLLNLRLIDRPMHPHLSQSQSLTLLRLRSNLYRQPQYP